MTTSSVVTTPITVRTSRQFDAPPERVFDGWFRPVCLATFLLGEPAAGKAVQAHFDPRVGGRFRVSGSRNGASVELQGSYLEVARPERLVFSLTADGHGQEYVTVELAALGRGCLLVLLHEMELARAPDRAQLKLAWDAALRQLGEERPPFGAGAGLLSLGALA